MENDRSNRRLSEVSKLITTTEDLGIKYFDTFVSSVAESSHVPKEFNDAITNLGSETNLSSGKDPLEKVKDATGRLLGIEFKTSEEALYVISLGSAVSLVKTLENPSLEEDQREEIRKRAVKMIGQSELVKESLISRKSGRINRALGRQSQNAIYRVKDLEEQLEQQVSNPEVRSRIILLAQPKKI